MKLKACIAALSLALVTHSPFLFAYGGGGSSSSSCSEPRFYDESPTKNSVIKSLTEFSIVASDNTDVTTLNLEINGQKVQPSISALRSGEWQLHVQMPEALSQTGKIRITLEAKSKDGCSTFHPIYLEIKP